MNISALELYVERRNNWERIIGRGPLSLLNPADHQRIADAIDSDLSPENLTCDGELSASQVRERSAYLRRCAEELRSINPEVKFYEFG